MQSNNKLLFPHLHVHSAFSLAEGALPLTQIPKLCLKNNIPAIAVTDSNNLFALWEAQEVLLAKGIQPIIGLQLSISGIASFYKNFHPNPSIVLLVTSEIGYKNLLYLSSQIYLKKIEAEEVFSHTLSIDDLKNHSEGLICLTGGHFGVIEACILNGDHNLAFTITDQLQNIFQDRLFIELQRYENFSSKTCENFMLELSIKKSLPIMASNEIYYPYQSDFAAHDALLCISGGRYIHEENRRKVSKDHYFKSAKEMHELFSDYPIFIQNSIDIAKYCTFLPCKFDPILPKFLDKKEDETNLLIELANKNLATKISFSNNSVPDIKISTNNLARKKEDIACVKSENTNLTTKSNKKTNPINSLNNVVTDNFSIEDYQKRLDNELAIINEMGFAGYFLIVADFIVWAKNKNIPVGPGRGSGAGSLVAYVLGITNINPLKYGLIFERFLNPERVSLPDFDIDFCQERRDEVISYVRDKYSHDRVAHIITFGRLQPRAVIRDVGRVFNMPYGQINDICKLVPNNPSQPVTLSEAIKQSKDLSLLIHNNEQVKSLIDTSLKLEGLYRHASTHAAGVVIAERPLTELCPLYHDQKSLLPATQYNMKYVDYCGLIKFDFLGLKTLTVIDKTLNMIDNNTINADNIPIDDPKIYSLICTGNTIGIFQLESSGMRETLKAAQPQKFEDIIALISLYRPGPMENIPTYIKNKQNPKHILYMHPILEPILTETYGVVVYQEQVMQIARQLCGYTMGEADELRRAIGKKKKEAIEAQKEHFFKGANENKIPNKITKEIYALVEKFGGYGFNKSHAASYAVIACQCAWLKFYYPSYFYASLMTLDISNTDKLAIFIRDIKYFKINIIAPNINRSQSSFIANDQEIIYGLAAIKGLGEQAMQAIVDERTKNGLFKNIYDYLTRIPAKYSGRKTIETLAKAGAFDVFDNNRAQIIESADFLSRWSNLIETEKAANQQNLFATNDNIELTYPELKPYKKLTLGELLEIEYETLGLYLTGHPLDIFCQQNNIAIGKSISSAYDEIFKHKSKGTAINVFLSSYQVRKGKTGKTLCFLTLSDNSQEIETIAYEETYDKCKGLIENEKFVRIFLAPTGRPNDNRLLVKTIRKISQTHQNTQHQDARHQSTQHQDARHQSTQHQDNLSQSNMPYKTRNNKEGYKEGENIHPQKQLIAKTISIAINNIEQFEVLQKLLESCGYDKNSKKFASKNFANKNFAADKNSEKENYERENPEQKNNLSNKTLIELNCYINRKEHTSILHFQTSFKITNFTLLQEKLQNMKMLK